MNVPAIGRRRGSTSNFSLSWLVALSALAELKNGTEVSGRDLRALYNFKAQRFGIDTISAQTFTAMMVTMSSRGLITRSYPRGKGLQRYVSATAEGLRRLEQARKLLDDCL